jgi:hypothetical protein
MISLDDEDRGDTKGTAIEISSDEDNLDVESLHGLSSPVKSASASAVRRYMSQSNPMVISSDEDGLEDESFHGLSSPMKPASIPAVRRRTLCRMTL